MEYFYKDLSEEQLLKSMAGRVAKYLRRGKKKCSAQLNVIPSFTFSFLVTLLFSIFGNKYTDLEEIVL